MTLITVSESSQSDLVIDQRQSFKFLAERIAKILSKINVVTVELRRKGLTLAESKDALDCLLNAVRAGKNNEIPPFYQCQLCSYYISLLHQ